MTEWSNFSSLDASAEMEMCTLRRCLPPYRTNAVLNCRYAGCYIIVRGGSCRLPNIHQRLSNSPLLVVNIARNVLHYLFCPYSHSHTVALGILHPTLLPYNDSIKRWHVPLGAREIVQRMK